MGKIKEKEAIELLLKRLHMFLNSTKREDLAKDIDDLASFDLMDYNAAYEGFSDELKDILDPLLLFGKWKGNGIYYGKEKFFGMKETRELVQKLKKLKRDL